MIDINGKSVPLDKLPCSKCKDRYSIHCPSCEWNKDGKYNTYGDANKKPQEIKGGDGMHRVLSYDDFTVYEDSEGRYYLDKGENDEDNLEEIELIAKLTYSAVHDLACSKDDSEKIMDALFDCDVCGENVLDDRIEYLWFKKKTK